MGNKASQEDPLIEDGEEIQPVFDELNLVLIGSKGAGKNKVGNAIFGKRVFTFWTSYRSGFTEETHTVHGRKINLARTPGWRGDLCRSEKAKREIVHCVQSLYNTGPHAVLLVLKVNSRLSESTIRTLEDLLTVQLWEHTIVVFTEVEKLGRLTIEDYIRCQQLQPLVDKCGGKYLEMKTNGKNEIITAIEMLIIQKNSASCFKLSELVDDNALLLDWKQIVERINTKINSILDFKEKKAKDAQSDKQLFETKDVEIERLRSLLTEKEKEIERLNTIVEKEISRHTGTQDPDLSTLLRTTEELQSHLYIMSNELKEKDTENKALKYMLKEKESDIEELKNEVKKIEMWQEKAIEWIKHKNAAQHVDYCSELSQNVSEGPKGQNQTQLGYLPAKDSALKKWPNTLLQILNELTNDELKKMKYYMCQNENYKIDMSSVKDRVDLAEQMLKQWGEWKSLLITRDLMKKIPRNDETITKLLCTFLE